MQFSVSFSKIWSVSEVKDFIADPEALEFTGLDKDAYLELAACAECYVNADTLLTDEEMNAGAKASIAAGMGEYFFDDMCDNYIADCLDTIRNGRVA